MKDMEANLGGKYTVTKDGRVFNLSGKELKQRINDKGYPAVCLSFDGVPVCRRVHRLVAQCFIPNPENKPCVNHKDRNRANPHVDNLEWATYSENVIHSVKNGGRKGWTRNNTGSRNANAKRDWHTIRAIRCLYNSGEFSQNELQAIFGIGQGQITKIVNNKRWAKEN